MLTETKVDEMFVKEMDFYRQKIAGKGLFESCAENIVLFSERMLGIKLYSWQIAFLTRISASMSGEYWTKEFVALTSRQIGKSTAVAILALWSCVFNKYPGTIHNNTIVGIASATDVQAKKLLNEIRKLMYAGNTFIKINYVDDKGTPKYGDDFFTNLLSDDQANNSTTISFKAWSPNLGVVLKDSRFGSVIKSYPPTSAILGETFTIVIEDEAGLSDKMTDEFHYDYMYPTGNSTNAIRVYTSTPWVSSGFFYQLADPQDEFPNHPAERVLFTYKAIEIENPGYYTTLVKTIGDMNNAGKTDEVQRAYLCNFVKGQKSYFDPKDVYNAFDTTLFLKDGFSGQCDMGIDFGGQTTSKTVITITALKEDGRHAERLYHKSYEVNKDMNLLADIEDLLKVFNIQRIIVDDCPEGHFLTRVMIEQKGWNVIPMNFRSEKVKKYGAFRSSLKKGYIKSYEDVDLRAEMLALEFGNTTKQSLIQHAPGYTDDLIDSFLMSCYFYIEDENTFKMHDIDEIDVDDGVTEWIGYGKKDTVQRSKWFQ